MSRSRPLLHFRVPRRRRPHQAPSTRHKAPAVGARTKHKALLYAANGGAVSADITSANTVGYITATIPASGNKTFAVTLTDCANPGSPVRVDKLLTSSDFFGSGTFDAADLIWRWDTTVNGWAKYFYEKTGRGASAKYAWKKYNYAQDKVEDLTDADKLAPGDGFLFRRAGETMTFTWKALQSAE